MRRLFLAAALAIAPSPVFAQDAAPAVDPARRALAQAVVDIVLPPATREQMTMGMVAPMLANMRRAMSQNPQFAKVIEADPRVKTLFDQFMEKQTGRTMAQLRDALPGMSVAITNAYARRFDLTQLREIKAFFESPTGHVYARESMTIMNDPDVAAWQRSLLTRSMGHVQEDVADFTKQVVALESSGKKP